MGSSGVLLGVWLGYALVLDVWQCLFGVPCLSACFSGFEIGAALRVILGFG